MKKYDTEKHGMLLQFFISVRIQDDEAEHNIFFFPVFSGYRVITFSSQIKQNKLAPGCVGALIVDRNKNMYKPRIGPTPPKCNSTV